MNALVFDTETNGKAKNFKAPMSDVHNWPRITQLGWQLVNIFTGEVVKEHQSLILPDGWTIPTVEELTARGEKDPYFFERNGMSTERCMEEGEPIARQLSLLIDAMNDPDTFLLVAHNIQFDENVTGAEMIRLRMNAERKLKRICTMQTSTAYCRLQPFRFGKYKWPTLQELHNKLFGCDFEGAHDAMDDVKATAKCLVELVKLKVIIVK